MWILTPIYVYVTFHSVRLFMKLLSQNVICQLWLKGAKSVFIRFSSRRHEFTVSVQWRKSIDNMVIIKNDINFLGFVHHYIHAWWSYNLEYGVWQNDASSIQSSTTPKQSFWLQHISREWSSFWRSIHSTSSWCFGSESIPTSPPSSSSSIKSST